MSKRGWIILAGAILAIIVAFAVLASVGYGTNDDPPKPTQVQK